MTCSALVHGVAPIAPHRSITHEPAPSIISFDTIGPIFPASTSGAQYILILIYNISKHLWCVPMKPKSAVSYELISIILLIDWQFPNRIKLLHSDNARELYSFGMTQFLRSKGIRHSTTPPYHSQSCLFAERVNRTIINTIRCNIFHSGLPYTYLEWALRDSVFNYICIPYTKTKIPPNAA